MGCRRISVTITSSCNIQYSWPKILNLWHHSLSNVMKFQLGYMSQGGNNGLSCCSFLFFNHAAYSPMNAHLTGLRMLLSVNTSCLCQPEYCVCYSCSQWEAHRPTSLSFPHILEERVASQMLLQGKIVTGIPHRHLQSPYPHSTLHVPAAVSLSLPCRPWCELHPHRHTVVHPPEHDNMYSVKVRPHVWSNI